MTYPIKMWLFRDLPNMHLNVQLIADDQTTLLNHTLNFCNFDRIRKSNIFLKLFSDVLLKYASFKFTCPFKKGLYEIPEHVSDDENTSIMKYIPQFFKLVKIFELKCALQRRLNGQLEDFIRIREKFELKFVE